MQLLLRLEKYPDRMYFAKGILESRKQHYKALKSVLKPIPLNSPTDVEVGLGRFIKVTLLDANHCIGAVMFLIEDEQKAILYTGDIRSETWWVNSLARNPIIIPYTLGTKRLDKIYLDTTFATRDERYRRFQSKAAGINELLEKVSKYPQDTVFHFHAWTLGYEDVWIALSNGLKTQVHVDDYKRRLYGFLASENPSQFQHHEGSALFGFKNGNHIQKGCLTSEKSVRLHSCEHGTGCPASNSSSTVYISPIINRGENGEILPEVGAGGGAGDLLQNYGYLELNDQTLTKMLIDLCDDRAEDPTKRSKIRDNIIKALGTDDKTISLDALALWDLAGDIKLNEFVENLIQLADSSKKGEEGNIENSATREITQNGELPFRIQFPYSRHSSYEELRELVAAFRPCDIYPCTTDWQEWSWDEGVESLFGDLCSGTIFAYDREMAGLESQRALSRGLKRPRSPSESQPTSSSPIKALCSSQVKAGSAVERPARAYQGRPDPIEKTVVACPKRRIIELRHSFERPLEAAKERSEFCISACDSRERTSRPAAANHKEVSFQFHLDDGDLQTLALHRSFSAREQILGTQAKPIELPDGVSSQSNSQSQGNFLLEDLPEPENIKADTNEHSVPETQISLSDSAFESQLSNLSPQKQEAQIHYRKHAYKAARYCNGAWAEDHGLMSSGANHGNEEVEL